MKGPRSFSGDGLPLHDDNETIVKERIFLDKASPDRLHDEIVTIDHALTRPWTVFRTYKREHNPFWSEFVCAENNNQLVIKNQHYVFWPLLTPVADSALASADGRIVVQPFASPAPTRKEPEATTPVSKLKRKPRSKAAAAEASGKPA